MNTNAPRMVTVVLALAFLVVGMAIAILRIEAIGDPVMDLVRQVSDDVTRQEVGWWALLISPLLLTIGSFFKGV